MSRAERHTPGEAGTISLDEARTRWQQHQTRIQRSLGRPGLALRLAPPGSPQYRLAKKLLGSSSSSQVSDTWPPRLEHTWSPPQPPFLPAGVLWRAIGESAELIDETNALVASASEYHWILAVSADDMQSGPNGLSELLDGAPNVDVLYCDETAPGFENLTPPTPGRHSTLSYAQLGRSVFISREAWMRLGGLDRTLGEASIADLLNRLVEFGATFARANTTVAWPQAPAAIDPRATERALQRRGIAATVVRDGERRLDWRVSVPSPAPSVDILIPTRDRLDLLRQCIESIRANTEYENYQIVVLDNDSSDEATLAYLESFAVTKCPGVFNYARIINRGVAASSAEVIVTLNNDVIITDPTWLTTLVGYALLPDVGIAGPRLVNGDGASDHDGITITPYPQHLQRGVNYGWDDDFVHAIRNVAAVTGACQVFERRKWSEVGGMDETLAVTFNDIDICLKMNGAGYQTLFTPYVELVHIGKASRGTNEALEDHYRFIQYWDIGGVFVDEYAPAKLELIGPRYSIRP